MMLTRRDAARGAVVTATLASLGTTAARAAGSTAPGIAVFCDAPLRSAMTEAGRRFADRAGAPVHVFCAAPWMMLAQIERMTQTDVLVTLASALDDGTRRGLVRPESRVPVGRNHLVLAGRPGKIGPAVTDAAAIRKLVGTGPLAAPDATAMTTIDSAAAVAAMGFAPPYPFRLVGGSDADDVAFLIASGAAPLGLLYRSEIGADAALALAAVVPRFAPITYAAAITTVTRSPNAERFMAFLRSPEAAASLRASGLEVSS